MCNPDDENPCVSGTPTQAQIDNDHRSLAQRQHDALVAVGRSVLESGELGQHNGLPTSIIIRTTLQDLESRAGVGVSGGGTVIPISDVIRMAAHANHYLAVFDKATGSALDLFRARRVASPAQRIMLIARDGGCTKPGCTVPAYGSQVHHAARDWADDGQTNVDELGLACGPDNRMVGPGGWTTRINDRQRRRMDPTARPRHRSSPRQRLPPPRTTPPSTRRRTDGDRRAPDGDNDTRAGPRTRRGVTAPQRHDRSRPRINLRRRPRRCPDPGRSADSGSGRIPVGELLVRHRPAVVVHRRLIAGAVGDEVCWVGGGLRGPIERRPPRKQARREDSRHSATLRRVIP